MHSSEKMGGFVGPGMRYHRRAESMPEIDIFEQAQLGFGHRISNPAMADAIEEEEEDEQEEKMTTGQPKADVFESALGVHVVEARASDEQAAPRKRRPFNTLGESQNSRAITQADQRPFDVVEIADAEDEPRFSILTKVSDETATTPTPSVDHFSHLPPCFPPATDPTVPSNTMAPQTPSSVPSPDFGKSSFDKHNDLRIHTAHSSITDRATLNSARTGDQRIVSVDDVPSLTSSASTVISGHPMHYPSVGALPSLSAERSSSLSAATPARVRAGNSSKRSSLVSLSRLVSSSQNKSKLNIAELAPPDSPEKPERKKKRISRLKFWKSKEKLRLT